MLRSAPGLALGSVSNLALEASEEAVEKGWYFDFKLWERYQKRGLGTPMTSAIPQIAGLKTILEMIEEYGGKRWFFNLYDKRNEKIVKGVNELDLSLFPQKGFESPTINCIKTPEGVEGTRIYDAMRNEGFELAKGYGELSKTTFRIGNMGYIEEKDIDLMLDSLSKVLGKF